MNLHHRLAGLLFDKEIKSPPYYFEMYPKRIIGEKDAVTRLAPSPTGYLHLGVLFAALVSRRTANPGIFYVRIEDTDKKREMEGGIDDILSGLSQYGIQIDEGFVAPGCEKGDYGPYLQSKRAPIYHAFAKRLVEEGLAYPCFCTPDELAGIRSEQETQKLRTGYYGKWTRCRDLSCDEVKRNIEGGMPYVLRLRSPGDELRRISWKDGIKGNIEMPENDQDIVLLKTDGIPTYHFAHAVDDTLMGTTHVIRGDEWIASTPIHLQLFRLLHQKPPKYAHIAPLMKAEEGNKRKLSKRKDPEAAMRFYTEKGYPAESVTEYLLGIMSSAYEDWRRANRETPNTEFPFRLNKMSPSGALFDLHKLNDVSKNTISLFDTKTLLKKLTAWAKEYNPSFYELLKDDCDYAYKIFSIDRDVPKPRKDIAFFAEAPGYAAYFYDSLYVNELSLPGHIARADAAGIIASYKSVYDPADERDAWFLKIKELSASLGYASNMKEYKKDPNGYKGHVGDVSAVIRIAVTGRQNTPDLCAIMKLLGRDRVIRRLDEALAAWRLP